MTLAGETSQDTEAIAPSTVEDVCARLAENKRIQQPLPGGGMLHMLSGVLRPPPCVQNISIRQRPAAIGQYKFAPPFWI